MRTLALVSDAFGGRGGIAKFNRDLLSALCSHPECAEVVALPRLMPDSAGQLPAKLTFLSHAIDSKRRYGLAALAVAFKGGKFDLIICGHIHLLPLALLVKLVTRAPVAMIVHGVDAWQPTHSVLSNMLVRKIDALISVSRFTEHRFASWSKTGHVPRYILPNCVDTSTFRPAPRNAALLKRYNLEGRTVLLTVARLSAQEKYKGIDEVMEILPALAKEIPNLTYLVVGDGTDRTRLMTKARSLGLSVSDCASLSASDGERVGVTCSGNDISALNFQLSASPDLQSSTPLPSAPCSPQVVFTGWIRNEETAGHHQLADTFVMPGRGEGFGIVYLEAMACGIPVVASTADASAEVVDGCETAVAVDPGNRVELKKGILKALKLQRGVVPGKVEHYSNVNYNRRCLDIVESVRRRNPEDRKRRILVFRIGQLGDTIVALPAMWAIRQRFPDASLTLLCDRHPGKPHVLAADLLRGAGIFDHFESYVVGNSKPDILLRPFRMVNLLLRLRRSEFDTLVYLAPSLRTPGQIGRDRRFFAAAGIRNFFGMNGFAALPKKIPGQPLGAARAESDLLLARLAADGISVPAAGKGSLDLRIGPAESSAVDAWLAGQRRDDGRAWLGVGPGSKMPAKRWPEERFREVVTKLIETFDIWPVVFGGPEDNAMGERLLHTWGRGYNAAGALSLRGAAAALRRCALYLGNDTGTMHLAAAAGVPCVALFSARDWPGMWHPYGVRQKVLRSQIDCEGCGLMECLERHNECLSRIASSDVLAECERWLQQLANKPDAKSTQLVTKP